MVAGRRRKPSAKTPKPENRDVAEWMQMEWDRRLWTDELAAEACSRLGRPHTVSPASIFNYRHGLERISGAKIKAIAHGFEIDEAELIEKIGYTGRGAATPRREPTIEDYLVQAQSALDNARAMVRRNGLTA